MVEERAERQAEGDEADRPPQSDSSVREAAVLRFLLHQAFEERYCGDQLEAVVEHHRRQGPEFAGPQEQRERGGATRQGQEDEGPAVPEAIGPQAPESRKQKATHGGKGHHDADLGARREEGLQIKRKIGKVRPHDGELCEVEGCEGDLEAPGLQDGGIFPGRTQGRRAPRRGKIAMWMRRVNLRSAMPFIDRVLEGGGKRG